MKRKSTQKSSHVVAWLNKAEWDQVLEYLYSKDCALQKYALQRLSAWKARFVNSTPVAVESTAELVRCQVLDASGKLDTDELILLYGMALVRFVNLITERRQKIVSIPLRRLASQMNIPEWVVNLRHEITHGKLPTLYWCRKGCKFVLDWLHQEYWSRQLGSTLAEPWDSDSVGEEEEDLEVEDDFTDRHRKREIYRKEKHDLLHDISSVDSYNPNKCNSFVFLLGKARDLLLSYKKEQFQVLQNRWRKENRVIKLWPSPSSDLEWIVMQIKDFETESREALLDVLLGDGFLVPTLEQLEILDIEPSDSSDTSIPCIPRLFLQFWLPLLRVLNSHMFIQTMTEKLFLQLQLCSETSEHRTFYISGWISEILSCNNRAGKTVKGLTPSQRKMRNKFQMFVNPVRLQWKKLLSLCLDAPCVATPHLLQQILTDMDKPLPHDTQQKLLHLCCIYTQRSGSCPSPDTEQQEQPVYTLETLHKRAVKESPHVVTHNSNTMSQAIPKDPVTVPEIKEDLQEHLSLEVIAERAMALKGSPWQICTDNVKWKNYPLGKVPGQSDDPGCLMVDSFSTISVLDQLLDIDKTAPHSTYTRLLGRKCFVRLGSCSESGLNHAVTDGPLWTHSDLSKLKAGLQLF
uniref:LAS1 like ribosome biogenesis factor n=1 Tax=Lepisosteus oculatus TaxID=7918 RepID=W5NBK5_LEPOC